jgi:GT2 family glycosyltransferase
MDSPTVGAIIVNWNSFEVLKRCLTTLFDQEVVLKNIVIIDNCSEIIPDAYFDTCPENTLYIRLQSNVGFAKANNIGLQKLEDCDWIALINPDVFLDSGWLKNMIGATILNPDFSFFASRLVMANKPALLDGMGDVYHASGLVWRNGHGQALNESTMLGREVFSPCAAAALYRRDALVGVGGFDETFFCYVEDIDLGFRLRLKGNRCIYVPDAIAYHIGSETTGGKNSNFAVYHGHRNLVWTYVKNMPGILFWLFLPYHFILNIFSLFWYSMRGQGKVIIRAKIDAIKGIPEMIRKRRKIQPNRTASLIDILRVIDKTPIPRIGYLLNLTKVD